jgi:photosystem II stability/assembly factor-like uncharacterized protein
MRVAAAVLAGAIAIPISTASVSAIDSWENITGNLVYKPSECGNLTLVSPVPGSRAIIAGIAGRGLWVNMEAKTWSRLSEITSTGRIVNRPSRIVYDPIDPTTFWESGIYEGGGIYVTTDSGKTFRQLGDIRHNDYVSVDFSDPRRRTLVAGGHEQSQTVYLSSDAGSTWTNVGKGIPANAGTTTHPLVIDANVFLVNTPTGIFRTQDAGQTWRRVTAVAAPGPPLRTANGAIVWAANGGIVKSTDLGLTWTPLGQTLRPIQVVELPDRTLVAVGESTLMMSSNGGTTWLPFGPNLPYVPGGVTYFAARQSFVIWRGDCGAYVPADAIMEFKTGD